jgi:hypothetical protein
VCASDESTCTVSVVGTAWSVELGGVTSEDKTSETVFGFTRRRFRCGFVDGGWDLVRFLTTAIAGGVGNGVPSVIVTF